MPCVELGPHCSLGCLSRAPVLAASPNASDDRSHCLGKHISSDCSDIASTGYTDLSVGWERTRQKSAALSGRAASLQLTLTLWQPKTLRQHSV